MFFKKIQECISQESHRIAPHERITTGRFLLLNIDASFWARCSVCGNGDLGTLTYISFQKRRNCVRLNRRRTWVAPSFVIAARRRVGIAAKTRFPCDWGSVSLTGCRLTRGQTACGVKNLKPRSLIKTFGWCPDDPEFAAKVCLRVLQIYSDPS